MSIKEPRCWMQGKVKATERREPKHGVQCRECSRSAAVKNTSSSSSKTRWPTNMYDWRSTNSLFISGRVVNQRKAEITRIHNTTAEKNPFKQPTDQCSQNVREETAQTRADWTATAPARLRVNVSGKQKGNDNILTLNTVCTST
jgi:hypothetical protein